MKIICIAITFWIVSVDALYTQTTPDKILSALVIKIIQYDRSISEANKNIHIYVWKRASLASEMKSNIGKLLGSSKLTEVTHGNGIPISLPSVIIASPGEGFEEITNYAEKNKILVISDGNWKQSNGASVWISIGDDKKPKITVDINVSLKSAIDWNSALFKVAQVIR